VYWGLQLSSPGRAPAAVAASGFDARIDAKAVARLLGQTDATAAPAAAPKSRYDLLGVLRRGDGRLGAAVIAVDGRPARTVVVGRHVGERDAGVVLSELGERSATLTPQGGEPIRLTMPALASPYTASNSPPASAVGQPARQTGTPPAGNARFGQPPSPPAGTPGAPALKPSFVPAAPAGSTGPSSSGAAAQAAVRDAAASLSKGPLQGTRPQ
jgi:general secretion pathway protein C